MEEGSGRGSGQWCGRVCQGVDRVWQGLSQGLAAAWQGMFLGWANRSWQQWQWQWRQWQSVRWRSVLAVITSAVYEYYVP